MRTVLQIKTHEIDAFLQLCKEHEIECTDVQRAKQSGKPVDFYFCEIIFVNPACLFDIGRALEALTKP